MPDQQAYECKNCKSQVVTEKEQSAPDCCGKTMASIPLEQCTLSSTAEHSRLDKDDEPCDDGRSG